jgi:S1-C subfamily serine protease
MYGMLFWSLVGPSEAVDWRSTLDEVVPAVVSIRVNGTRDFDTEGARHSQGTGFIVDAERGLVLTNRHLVHAGPVVAEAVLLNNEEVELTPIYRDPIHDFGLYQFDPATVRHMPVMELRLAPEMAEVGLDIRVIGNDAGEKLSILDGTLARLDRNAPSYGSNNYNDFNTFYIQAASNTSGGSSGSPVVAPDGSVVALNAGGKSTSASSYYLPLQRVVRALDLIRSGEPVSRGTMQAVYRYTPYDELARLGLSEQTEARARAESPYGTGMLVVTETVPGGPARAAGLEPGDVLLGVGGQYVGDFVTLEALLDDAVGGSLPVLLERGGAQRTVMVSVHDLHAISPSRYLEVSRGVFHDLSYQQARNHSRPMEGVYVAASGHMLSSADIPPGTVIQSVNGVATPTVDAFAEMLGTLAQGDRFRVRFDAVGDVMQQYEAVAVMDRLWSEIRMCERDDTTGTWPCVSVAANDQVGELVPADVVPPLADDRLEKVLAPSLVTVEFDIPYPTAGVKGLHYAGVGVVVDAEEGLILVDRDTVPVALGDLVITFAGSVRVPGVLRYLHPVHNVGVVSYDPALLGDTAVAAVRRSDRGLKKGDRVWQVGLDREQALVSQRTRVDAMAALTIGASKTPRFRDSNLVVGKLAEAAPSLGGVVVDRRGRMQALWGSFYDPRTDKRSFHAVPLSYIEPMLDRVRSSTETPYKTLGAEVRSLRLADARDRGLSDERVRAFVARGVREVLQVLVVHGGTPASEVLRDTDVLIELDGELLTDLKALESLHDRDRVEVVYLRDGREHRAEVDLQGLTGGGVDRVLQWAGLILHAPHYGVQAQGGRPPYGVYASWLWYGTPAARYGFRPTRHVVQIDDVPTPDLDTLIDAIRGMEDRQAVRVKTVGLDGSVRVQSLKLDLTYWPTWLFESDGSGWTRTVIDGGQMETSP